MFLFIKSLLFIYVTNNILNFLIYTYYRQAISRRTFSDRKRLSILYRHLKRTLVVFSDIDIDININMGNSNISEKITEVKSNIFKKVKKINIVNKVGVTLRNREYFVKCD